MRMTAECVPCLLRRTLLEARLVDPGKEDEVMASALEILAAGFRGDPSSAGLASEVHRATYGILGTDDPYREYKRMATEEARAILPLARSLIEGSDDPFETAVLVSVVGNVLEFGIEGALSDPAQLETRFREVYSEGLGAFDAPGMREHLRPGSVVVFFTDNCGEVLFDRLLIEVLGDMGVEIILVVKGAPILTDATAEDAVDAGLDGIVDRILTTGSDHVGFEPEEFSDELVSALSGCDLVISKGMANYEAFTETDISPIAYLLRTKCTPVARSAGFERDLNVAFIR